MTIAKNDTESTPDIGLKTIAGELQLWLDFDESTDDDERLFYPPDIKRETLKNWIEYLNRKAIETN